MKVVSNFQMNYQRDEIDNLMQAQNRNSPSAEFHLRTREPAQVAPNQSDPVARDHEGGVRVIGRVVLPFAGFPVDAACKAKEEDSVADARSRTNHDVRSFDRAHGQIVLVSRNETI